MTYTTQTPDYEPVGLKVYVHIVDCMNIDLRSVCKWSSTPELAQEGANVAQLVLGGGAAQSRSQVRGEMAYGKSVNSLSLIDTHE